jgi:hypothetical protein
LFRYDFNSEEKEEARLVEFFLATWRVLQQAQIQVEQHPVQEEGSDAESYTLKHLSK